MVAFIFKRLIFAFGKLAVTGKTRLVLLIQLAVDLLQAFMQLLGHIPRELALCAVLDVDDRQLSRRKLRRVRY